MSSSHDAGYYAEDARKEKEKKCKKSSDGKHKWKRIGTGPSSWDECIHCKVSVYYK